MWYNSGENNGGVLVSMELTTAYLYNQSPIDVFNISESTFQYMLNADWFEDERQPKNFKILNKRFKHGESIYRVVLRFRMDTPGVYKLDVPIPFAVILSERYEIQKSYGSDSRFRDIKVWHGKDVKNTIGFFQAGVPIQLIDDVIIDLQAHVKHVDEPDVDIDVFAVQKRPILMMNGREIGQMQSVRINTDTINGRPVRRVESLQGGDLTTAIEADVAAQAVSMVRSITGVGVAEALRLFNMLDLERVAFTEADVRRALEQLNQSEGDT
jgi:hypothetical protein